MSINKSFTIVSLALAITLAIITLASTSTNTPATTSTTSTTVAQPRATVVITAPATTTTTEVTTTTIDPVAVAYQEQINNYATIYPRCAEWLPLLLEVGGDLEDWKTWSQVLWTESRCIPTALSPSGDCVGLTQIYYKVHSKWLTDLGISRDDLFDPATNLRFAVMLQDSSGWSPWAYLNKP